MAASSEPDKMNQLIKKREDIETEIKALNEVLDSQKSVGMDAPLVDTEGFPRADIDIYSVRHARHQIICLENDYKELMEEIEEELYKIHARARQTGGDTQTQTTHMTSACPKPNLQLQPIGTVTSVEEGSPAHLAGLLVNDAVVQFGSLTSENFQGIQNISAVVQHSIDKSIAIKVLRANEVTTLSLTPSRWKPDKGLLGCNIKPVTKS